MDNFYKWKEEEMKKKSYYVKGSVNVPRHVPVIKVNPLLFIILFKTKKIQARRQVQ